MSINLIDLIPDMEEDEALVVVKGRLGSDRIDEAVKTRVGAQAFGKDAVAGVQLTRGRIGGRS
jgi:ribosomal protein L18E